MDDLCFACGDDDLCEACYDRAGDMEEALCADCPDPGLCAAENDCCAGGGALLT